jgi:hypothetical protein
MNAASGAQSIPIAKGSAVEALLLLKATCESLKDHCCSLPNPPERRTYYHLLDYAGGQLDRAATETKANAVLDLAWIARNLFECAILVQYVCESPHNLERFWADWPINEKQLIEVFEDWEREANPAYIREPQIADHVEFLDKQITELGLDPNTGYLRVGTIAEKLGREREYKTFNKICSKLAHPTGFSILADEPQLWTAYVRLLAKKSVQYGDETVSRITEKTQYGSPTGEPLRP